MEPIKIIGETGKYPVPKPWLFRPVRAFRIKLFVYYLLLYLLAITIAFLIDVARSLWFDLRGEDFIPIFLSFALISFIFFTILVIIFLNIYVDSFEYQVHGTETIIKKGLVNITENHVPFSNITNISLRRGPLDQIFKIGTIIIHTAGEMKGTNTKIKMEGIKVFKEVGYYIVKEIKTVESFLSTITLDPQKKHELFSKEFWKEFLEETKEIRENLKK